MARRGDQLREHILWAAKDAFLESGFERASMDAVAARAETSKRTLYAHFESKENLFLEVIELVRRLVLARLGVPADYSPDPESPDPERALVLFGAKYLEILRYEPTVQMCRLILAETARFPQGAARHYDAMFTEAHARLSAYLEAEYGRPKEAAETAARALLGQILYPRLLRALFGLEDLDRRIDPDAPIPPADLALVRGAVAAMVASFESGS